MLSLSPPSLRHAAAQALCHHRRLRRIGAAPRHAIACLKLKLLCELELAEHLPLFLSLFSSSSSHAQVGQGIGPGAVAAARFRPGAPHNARPPIPGEAPAAPADRLHREILVSRNNVAQIFTRSFNDDGRTMCDAKLRRCDACTPCRRRADAKLSDAAHGTLY